MSNREEYLEFDDEDGVNISFMRHDDGDVSVYIVPRFGRNADVEDETTRRVCLLTKEQVLALTLWL